MMMKIGHSIFDVRIDFVTFGGDKGKAEFWELKDYEDADSAAEDCILRLLGVTFVKELVHVDVYNETEKERSTPEILSVVQYRAMDKESPNIDVEISFYK